jgi:uncharacterized protein
MRTLNGVDRLPLTCTRAGTCCHGIAVWINPRELAVLAGGLGLPTRVCRDRRTTDGGIRLRMDGAPGWQGRPACTVYDPAHGCAAHGARPLACRLYPLGRRVDADGVQWLSPEPFPCLAGCPEVTTLTHLSVDDYLAGQDVADAAACVDAYRGLVADLADTAGVVAVDSGLAALQQRQGDPGGFLAGWQAMARRPPLARAASLGHWLDLLTLPDLDRALSPEAWVSAHHDRLQQALQEAFSALANPAAVAAASATCIGLALHLGQSLGADAGALADGWIGRMRARLAGVRAAPD